MEPAVLAASLDIDSVDVLELDRRVFSTGLMGLTSGLVGWEVTAGPSVVTVGLSVVMEELSVVTEGLSVMTADSWWVGMRERNRPVGREAIFIGCGRERELVDGHRKLIGDVV